MQCPNCGNPDVTSKFCPKCGTPMPDSRPRRAADEDSGYDPAFNPYESVARQRAEIESQIAPPPRPVAFPQQQKKRAAPKSRQPQKREPGYKPSLGENLGAFFTDPALFYERFEPRTQIAGALLVFFLVNSVQAVPNLLLYGLTTLAEQGAEIKYLYRAAFTAAYPLAVTLLAALVLAAHTRRPPALRALFSIYTLAFFPFLLSAAPLPMTLPASSLLCVLHVRAGLDRAFDLSPRWRDILALGVPLFYWIAAGAMTRVLVFL